MPKKSLILILSAVIVLMAACVPGPDFVVDSSGDDTDANVGDGKCETANSQCTLRAAIMEADFSADINTITFSGPFTIAPASPLPPLTAGSTHIDGNAQVTLDGSQISSYENYGIEIAGSSFNSVAGITIKNFTYGIYLNGSEGTTSQNIIGLPTNMTGDGTEANVLIWNETGVVISGQNASGNTVAGNFIGTGANGMTAKPNEFAGVMIAEGAHNNLIGSLTGNVITQHGGANLISGNLVEGVFISEAPYNHISGNFIGTTIAGNAPLPNGEGIRIVNADYNSVGLNAGGDGFANLISGNTYEGIALMNAYASLVAGNLIGVNYNQNGALPNRSGILLSDESSQNVIGTNGDGTNDGLEGNLISGNSDYGVLIIGTTTIKNVIAGNQIGTNAAGTSAIGNGSGGISISGDMNRVGTDGDGVSDTLEGNLISGNSNSGVQLNAFSAIVAGNLIGTDSSGLAAVGNGYHGIMINEMSHGNLIGTNGDGISDVLERNLISGNGTLSSASAGIHILGDDNTISGNFIGADITGSTGLGNSGTGVSLTSSASGNLVGTDGDGSSDSVESNLISGNAEGGVWIVGGQNNTVAGNKIGTDFTGSLAIPNSHAVSGGYGAVQLYSGAAGNIIGTNSDGNHDAQEGNLISGNACRGVIIDGASTQANIVAGNFIGTDASGSGALGNLLGVDIGSGATQNRIGTDGNGAADFWERNLISGNSSSGVSVDGLSNQIAGNYIGTDASGSGDLGNGTYGVYIYNGAANNTIGGSTQKSNIIAFNGKDGVYIEGENSDGNLISANSIFSNDESGIDLADGTAAAFTPNDPGDFDTGPNDLLNFPVLSSASSVTIAVSVSGQIVSGLPGTNFLIEFFANDVCDSPGSHGEGQSYLGAKAVTTNSNGFATFATSLNGLVPAGKFLTATASTGGSTSEFSQCIEIEEGTTQYSGQIDGGRCGFFEDQEFSVVMSDATRKDLYLYLYVKSMNGYPGLDFDVPGDTDEFIYQATLGEAASIQCGLQGIFGRLYCDFNIPEKYLNTAQDLKIFLNNCDPAVIEINDVSIFEKVICTPDLDRSACQDAGGTYQCVAACTCVCP